MALPAEGAGYEVPAAWRTRDRGYATDEVVRWLTSAFRTVHDQLPGGVAAVGDLSGRSGGANDRHRSHESGRDIDIFFYAEDRSHHPMRPRAAMIHYTPDGRARAWSPPVPGLRIAEPLPHAVLDAARTWALVRALLVDASVKVQWIFIQQGIAELLLREGRRAGDPAAVLAVAAALFRQPVGAEPHDDHMHVRVFCDPGDRRLGCIDIGPQRWWKKHWKYMSDPPPAIDVDLDVAAHSRADVVAPEATVAGDSAL